MNIIEQKSFTLYNIALVYDALENSVFNDKELFNEMERSKAFCTMVNLKLGAGNIRQQSNGNQSYLYINQGFLAHLHHRDGFISRTVPLQESLEICEVQNTLIDRRIKNDVAALMLTTPDWDTVAATPSDTLNYMKEMKTKSGTNVLSHYIKLCGQLQQFSNETIIDYSLRMLSEIKMNNKLFDCDWVDKITEKGIKAGEYKITFKSSLLQNCVILHDERTTLDPKAANEFTLFHNINKNTVNVGDWEVTNYTSNGTALKDTNFLYHDSKFICSDVISFSRGIELNKSVPNETLHLNKVAHKLFNIGKPIVPQKMVEHKIPIATSSLIRLIVNGHNVLAMDYIKMLKVQNKNPVYNAPLLDLMVELTALENPFYMQFDKMPFINEMVKSGYNLDQEINAYSEIIYEGDFNLIPQHLNELEKSLSNIKNSELYACYKSHLLAVSLESAIENLGEMIALPNKDESLQINALSLSL